MKKNNKSILFTKFRTQLSVFALFGLILFSCTTEELVVPTATTNPEAAAVSGMQKAASTKRVGDTGVTFDRTKFDSDWAQMDRWSKAGVTGGIPVRSGLVKGATVTTKTSAGITAAINSCASGKYVYLPDGTYTIDATVKMKSNVYLIGQSRAGVILNITATSGAALTFYNVSKSGIYNLTIQGGWGTPKYPWNTGIDANSEKPSNTSISVNFSGTTTNCFIDAVTVKNSGLHPVWCNATHNTFRDLVIDGCWNKGGGCQGYFMFLNSDNLITGCSVTHIRHISVQGTNAQYNVFYKNNFKQEISFHTDDFGNNLIEQNTITLPADMWSSYYAIMGPWSIQHVLGKINYVYKNNITELNHSGFKPWSDNTKIFNGPYMMKPSTDAECHNNFRAMTTSKVPTGGTLYPVVL